MKNWKLALAAITAVGFTAAADPPGKAPPPQAAPQAATAAQTSIVLVHGNWADGSSFSAVIPLLQAKGYNVVAVQYPQTSFADDVAAVKRVIAMQKGDVVLVGHSYGGVLITEAGNDPKVKKLVYVAAFAPDAGESVNSLGKGQPPPPWVSLLVTDPSGFSMMPLEGVMKYFAQDVPPAEQKVIFAVQGLTPVSDWDAKITTPAWKSKPSWYVRSAQDRMIDPAAEAAMAKRMHATTTSLNASHVSMVSHPKEVAAVILEAAAAKEVASK